MFKYIHLEVSIFLESPNPRNQNPCFFHKGSQQNHFFVLSLKNQNPATTNLSACNTTHLPQIFQQINDTSPPFLFRSQKKNTRSAVSNYPPKIRRWRKKNLPNSQRLSVLLAIQPFALRLMAKTRNGAYLLFVLAIKEYFFWGRLAAGKTQSTCHLS